MLCLRKGSVGSEQSLEGGDCGGPAVNIALDAALVSGDALPEREKQKSKNSAFVV